MNERNVLKHLDIKSNHACNLGTQGAEAGGFQICRQPGLCIVNYRLT